MRSPNKLDQGAAAIAAVAYIASEREAGREPDAYLLDELLADTSLEALAHLAGTLVWQVPAAGDELSRLGWRIASWSGDPP